MPWVKTCCCGCTLKTGCIIIGVWIIISSLAWVGRGIERGTSEGWNVTMSVFNAINFIIAIILIVGAVKEKKWLLMPSIIEHLIYYVIVLITIILLATNAFLVPEMKWGTVGALIILLIPHTYCLLIVYSHFQELKERGL